MHSVHRSLIPKQSSDVQTYAYFTMFNYYAINLPLLFRHNNFSNVPSNRQKALKSLSTRADDGIVVLNYRKTLATDE